MRAVVQRVKWARVAVEGEVCGEIGPGLLVYLGVGREDTQEDVAYLLSKVIELRIFQDPQGKMNLSLRETGGSLLVISQFTLYGDCRKGRRPSFIDAAPPALAEALYGSFIAQARQQGISTASGRFQAMM
ncbi:MAG: D-tyrosyl-tRNA(Tyr) deacylase, partial [Candidatus Tectomicrobia bacterium]|nr:D-tyrosyl-tRNA(Tyr) deacylase [Candidatus Tectomicrobia bacterium]